jgi:hypothetical protein
MSEKYPTRCYNIGKMYSECREYANEMIDIIDDSKPLSYNISIINKALVCYQSADKINILIKDIGSFNSLNKDVNKNIRAHYIKAGDLAYDCWAAVDDLRIILGS